VIVVGAAILIVACLSAPLTGDTAPISISLLLLGLGWNFCFVAGSTLLADQLSPAERARTQGFNDLVVGLASALGSFGSGIVSARLGYAGVGFVGVGVALLPIVLIARWRWAGRRVAG
jgi:predicted MFS family arabinose efflux permease